MGGPRCPREDMWRGAAVPGPWHLDFGLSSAPPLGGESRVSGHGGGVGVQLPGLLPRCGNKKIGSKLVFHLVRRREVKLSTSGTWVRWEPIAGVQLCSRRLVLCLLPPRSCRGRGGERLAGGWRHVEAVGLAPAACAAVHDGSAGLSCGTPTSRPPGRGAGAHAGGSAGFPLHLACSILLLALLRQVLGGGEKKKN